MNVSGLLFTVMPGTSYCLQLPEASRIISIKAILMQAVEQQCQEIVYVSCFSLFDPVDTLTICDYKEFIEHTIIDLGEDWRIESNLLAEEILGITKNKQEDSQYSLFNEYLLVFLKDKIGLEIEASQVPENIVQEGFIDEVSAFFTIGKINESLTFKTLSLGFCITAVDIWKRTFKSTHPPESATKMPQLVCFAKLQKSKIQSNPPEADHISMHTSSFGQRFQQMELLSANFSQTENEPKHNHQYKTSWKNITQTDLPQELLRKLQKNSKERKSLKKLHVLNEFVAHVEEIRWKDRYFRIVRVSSQFYKLAFIVWLIFNIKVCFTLTFADFRRYFKELLCENWSQQLERPLEKCSQIIEKEWKKRLNDYSVALHDDLGVLKILINRVHHQLENQWAAKLKLLSSHLS